MKRNAALPSVALSEGAFPADQYESVRLIPFVAATSLSSDAASATTAGSSTERVPESRTRIATGS